MKRLSCIIFFAFCLITQASLGNVSFTASKVCFLTQTTLTGSSSYPDSLISSWKWDLDNDGQFNDGNGKILNYFFGKADTFTVRLKVTTKLGITDSTSGQVIVYPLPQVNFHVDNPCEGKTAVFKDASSISSGAIVQYNWDFNNDGIIDNNSGAEVNFNCGPAATYISKLECVSDKGCRAFNVKTTEVFHIPLADFSSSATCLNDTISFANKTTLVNDEIAFYKWDFGDGVQSSAISPRHVFSTAQVYPVTLVAVSQNNCKDTLKRSITVHPAPEVTFSFSGDTVLYAGGSVTITASGNGLTHYQWSTGDTTNSTTSSKNEVVSLRFQDVNGCSGLKKTKVVVQDVEHVSLLNDIITPNGDGMNDTFVIENVDAYKSCTLSIFNTQNELIYRTTNYRNDWAGTYNGKPVDAGTYYYIISCSDQKQKAGSISILR